MGQKTSKFDITILTGLNAGVELELSAGRHSIGGEEANSIRLDGISGTLADFALERDRIKIKPKTGSITSKPGGVSEAGQVATLKLPTRIALTDEIEIFADKQPLPLGKSGFLKPTLAAAGIIAVALLFTAFQINLRVEPTQALATDTTPVPQQAVEAQVANLASTATSCTDCAADAADQLRAQVASAGLMGLAVTSSGGAVRVEGGLTKDQRAIWQDIRSGYDGRWAMVPLLLKFTDTKHEAPLSVASVWLGDVRELRTDTGKTMRIGDRVQGAWKISAIEEGYVELIQGETKLRVTY